jgi:hypothetical protein
VRASRERHVAPSRPPRTCTLETKGVTMYIGIGTVVLVLLLVLLVAALT